MKFFNHSILAGAITLYASATWAGKSVDESMAADPDGVVTIENVRGEVSIFGDGGDKVSVKGELDDLAEDLLFKRDGKIIRVSVPMPDVNVTSGDGSKLEIHIPKGNHVAFNGVSSEVEAADLGNGADVHTISGDVKITRLTGPLTVKSVSGDIHADSTKGVSQIKSVSGDLALDLDSVASVISTVSGDVNLKLGDFQQLTVNSVSGDLRLAGRLLDSGRIEVKTVSGECRLRLRGNINARTSVHTGPGGSIANTMNDEKPKEDFPSQSRLETTLGDGTGSIDVSTVTGEVSLEKE